MSKRTQEFQGGEERYGGMSGDSRDSPDVVPKNATAAQMARRKIAQARKPSGSQRSSRQGTPTGNVFGQQGTQSMPSFQAPSGPTGTGFGGGFDFAVNASSNPFAQTNGATGTPPPTSFQFGGQPQQNGGSGMFGSNNNSSFGGSFGGSNNTQTQQNGLAPSTTMFGQSQPVNGSTTPSTFGGFGQNTQSQTQVNGATPTTASTSSFPSFGKQNTNDNPFKSFGQSQQQAEPASSAPFTFGQSTQQNGDKPAATPFAFGQSAKPQSNGGPSLFASAAQAEQAPKPASNNVFSGFGQQINQAEQTPKPSLFGSQPSTAKGLFGSTPPPESSSQTPKLGESIFSSLNKKDGISANMFTSSRDTTPKPHVANIFGAASEQKDSSNTDQTSKPANPFGGFGQSQTNGVKPNPFGNAPTPSAEQQTPKPGANMFGGTFGQQPSKESTTPAFKFGQTQQQDTSMTTPGNTPQKQAEASSARPLSSANESSTTNAADQSSAAQTGKSIFDRIGARDEAPPTAQKSMFTPSTKMYNPTSTEENTAETPAPSQPSRLFERPSSRDPPATAFKPSPSISSQLSAAPWLTHGPSALTKAASAPSPQPPTSIALTKTASSSAKEVIPATEKKTFKALNEGLSAHLAKQDPNTNWTTIMQYYIAQAASITKQPTAAKSAEVPSVSITTPSATNTPQKTPQAPSNLFAASQSSASAAPSKSTSTHFGSATPKSTSLFQPPQTAPVNRKRRAEDDEAVQPPATEKRTRANGAVEYPKLPENASETSKLFQAALDRSTTMKPNPTPTKPATQEQKTQAKSFAEEKENKAPTQSFGGFKPSTTGFTPSAAGFTPSNAGFTPSATGLKSLNASSVLQVMPTTPSALASMPTFSAPSAGPGDFFAAFGRKASDEEEKERKKRKANDYDSDEETEEAWAARDKAEQEAKRQKIIEAAKSGAGFTPSDVGTPAPESDDGRGSEGGVETPAGQGKNLFDRVAPATAPSKPSLFSSSRTPAASKPTSNMFGSKTPAATSTSNIFGGAFKPRESIEAAEGDKVEAEKDQGTGDNTWKPNTPIKFGAASTATESTTPAAPPPAFGNLFGSLSGPKPGADTSGHLNIPKPSFGFNFGGQPSSASNSRATTPGVTTDGEGASTAGEGDDDDSAAPQNEPQVEDQTGLRDSEKEEEDLLFSVKIAKGMKWDEKKNDAGEISMGWVDRGKGPLYILKHKESGKVRVVLKVPPYGVTKMNFAPLKDILYEVVGKGGKMVQGVFIDHFDTKGGERKKLGKWMLQVGKKEDAEEVAAVLMRERA